MKKIVFAVILALIVIFSVSGYFWGKYVKTLSSSPIGASAADLDKLYEEITEEEETAPETTETEISCDDDNACTSDIFNEATETCEHTIIEDCCGNDRCEANERCNLETHRTGCVEDCTLLCPGFLIVHKTEEGTETEDFTYSCAGEGCEQLDEKDFAITGKFSSVGVKTVVTNIGEKPADHITSMFFCEELEAEWPARTTKDNDVINGVVISDYFGNKMQTVDSLIGITFGGNSVNYYLNFDTTNIQKSMKMRCVMTLQSAILTNQQDVLIDFYKPAE